MSAESRSLSRARARHVPGEPELWMFIFGDLAVFALFFGILGWNHATQGEVFTAGQAHLNTGFGLINTMVLITSSAAVAYGLDLARCGRGAAARRAYLTAAALGAVFVVVKAFEYGEHVQRGSRALAGDFYMYYFVFTGIHLVHVLVGLIALAIAAQRCRRLRSAGADLGLLEGVGIYWHMVDLLWIVLFYLIYIV